MAEAPFCPETGAPMVRGVRRRTIRYKGLTTLIDLPGWYCDASGESIHSRVDMRVSDRALADLKAQAEGAVAPSEVARLRKRLHLSQAEAGRLFGGGPRAFQKYESGAVRPGRSTVLALRIAERRPEEVLQMAAELAEADRVPQDA